MKSNVFSKIEENIFTMHQLTSARLLKSPR